jgi:hypothetical protein
VCTPIKVIPGVSPHILIHLFSSWPAEKREKNTAYRGRRSDSAGSASKAVTIKVGPGVTVALLESRLYPLAACLIIKLVILQRSGKRIDRNLADIRAVFLMPILQPRMQHHRESSSWRFFRCTEISGYHKHLKYGAYPSVDVSQAE